MRGKIRKPFFEVGPKAYVYGDAAMRLALKAEECSQKYDVDIIFTAAYTDIERIARHTKHIHVFAQHMDFLSPGRGIGAVLPEAIKEAGAEGVFLNHAEKPLNLYELDRCIQRAKEAGLISLVCAGNVREGAAVACLLPDIVLVEAPELIGKGEGHDMQEIQNINHRIRSINRDITIMHGAGIHDECDVYHLIRMGADGTGSSSGIINAKNPEDMLEKMVASVAMAWKERE